MGGVDAKKATAVFPSCLIISKLATGPLGITCVAPSKVVTVSGPAKVCGTTKMIK
jgi:hypothetical protein